MPPFFKFITMVNNFKQIRKLLSFDSKGQFYFVQILQRRKDGNNISGTNNTNRTIRTYRIDSLKKFDELQDEMIKLADFFNARVGINLNKRSYEKVAFYTLEKMAKQMSNRDYKNVKKAYDSVCGIHDSSVDRIWLIDIDEYKGKSLERNKFEIIKAIQHSRPIKEKKILSDIPSKNGCHLITKPFDTNVFYKDLAESYSRTLMYELPEIHKNNPTNLYIP